MLFLIVTMMMSSLCVVFDSYDAVQRALCCFLLLPCCLARSVLLLIVTMMFSSLSVPFYRYDDV